MGLTGSNFSKDVAITLGSNPLAEDCRPCLRHLFLSRSLALSRFLPLSPSRTCWRRSTPTLPVSLSRALSRSCFLSLALSLLLSLSIAVPPSLPYSLSPSLPLSLSSSLPLSLSASLSLCLSLSLSPLPLAPSLSINTYVYTHGTAFSPSSVHS